MERRTSREVKSQFPETRSIARGIKPNQHRYDKLQNEWEDKDTGAQGLTPLRKVPVVRHRGKTETIVGAPGLPDETRSVRGTGLPLGDIFSDREINRLDQVRKERDHNRR